MVPIEKRDFAYESEQLEDKFRVLRRDIDRFLNGRYSSLNRKGEFKKKRKRNFNQTTKFNI